MTEHPEAELPSARLTCRIKIQPLRGRSERRSDSESCQSAGARSGARVVVLNGLAAIDTPTPDQSGSQLSDQRDDCDQGRVSGMAGVTPQQQRKAKEDKTLEGPRNPTIPSAPVLLRRWG